MEPLNYNALTSRPDNIYVCYIPIAEARSGFSALNYSLRTASWKQYLRRPQDEQALRLAQQGAVSPTPCLP